MEENKHTEEELEQTNPSAEIPDEQTAEEQTTPAAEQPVEETAPAEDGETPAQEAASAEDGEATAQEAAPAENTEASAQEAAPAAEATEKSSSGRLALIIAAVLVVLAIAAVLLMGTILSQCTGGGKDYPVETIPASAPEETVEITEAATTEATIPADGKGQCRYGGGNRGGSSADQQPAAGVLLDAGAEFPVL